MSWVDPHEKRGLDVVPFSVAGLNAIAGSVGPRIEEFGKVKVKVQG